MLDQELGFKVKRFTFIDLFTTITLLELFIGGGGRLYDVGILSPRMYFFLFALLITFFYFIQYHSVSKDIIILVFFFSLTTLFSAYVGWTNNIDPFKIFMDLKPLSFFYIIVFLSIVIRTREDILHVVNLIKASAIFLAVTYLFVFILLNLHLINFAWLWHATAESEEFFFRGETAFMYKGFVYLAVGFFFYFRSTNLRDQFICALLLTAMLLTLTRGFILSWGVVYFLYLIFFGKNKILMIFLVFAIPVGLFSAYQFIEKLSGFGNKFWSNNIRFLQVSQVFEMITPYSIFWGHGLGVGVGVREIHMEIAYLEIFHKQGILGLLFWFGIFFILSVKFINSIGSENFDLVLPFFLSVVFIYIESFTNPFLLSPLGMVVVLLSWICFDILKRDDESSSNLINT